MLMVQKPEWRDSPHFQSVLPSYASSSTGCQLAYKLSSLTRHDPLTLLTSHLIYQRGHQDHATKYYYSEYRHKTVELRAPEDL